MGVAWSHVDEPRLRVGAGLIYEKLICALFIYITRRIPFDGVRLRAVEIKHTGVDHFTLAAE